MELNSSKANAGKELILSSWCIASLYIYHFTSVVDYTTQSFRAIAFELLSSMARAFKSIIEGHRYAYLTADVLIHVSFGYDNKANDTENCCH